MSLPIWGLGVLGVALGTFVLGFYLPANQANSVHTQQFQQLSAEYQGAVKSYEETNAALAKVQALSSEQGDALGKISSQETSARQALGRLEKKISTDLEKLIAAKLVTVSRGGQGVSIEIESMYLVYPHKTFVHAKGEQLLCQIADTFPSESTRPIEILAHANGTKPSSTLLQKQFPTSWQLSGVLAADVAEKLQSCGIAGKKLRAVGAAHFKGDAKKARKSAARFEIVVYPPKPES